MTYAINETHNPDLKSWVESANESGCDFPIQNLPFGVFSNKNSSTPRVGVAIGDRIFDVTYGFKNNLFTGRAKKAAAICHLPSLNAFMSLGNEYASDLRKQLNRILRADSPVYRKRKKLLQRMLIPMSKATMHLPAHIGNYTDFYASIHHATNVGSMFRPDNPLLPNYKFIPIGYHGRSSSIVVSGASIIRPNGQTKDDQSMSPAFGPTKQLDYELEVGCFIGKGNTLGKPIPIHQAEESMFGICLVNDWSARDIQKWEYQPLGPFLAKNFGTTISPWIVTMEALAPYRLPAYRRPAGDPASLPYLSSSSDQLHGGVDLQLTLSLTTKSMREKKMKPIQLSAVNFHDMYWTFAQMLTHHASNGCNLQPGDLIASGTVSGATKDSRGSMLELTWRGKEPIQLPTGEVRTFLEDGDEIVIKGFCEREGFVRIGLGECRGQIAPPEADRRF